ncbi:sodium-dependent glucose transporter 1-like [Haliotis cracherodii]|uniref:sodium-dependent glucose transporter 1-like n=1 Tax=Haliotis cracherodii TaxID=6455 RepID=UPI0039E80D1F
MGNPSDNQDLNTALCPYLELALLLALSGLDGLIDSSFGPSLQDLQCLYSVSVTTISVLFPVYAGFKTVGSVLYVPVHAVINVYTLMMVCVLVSSCLVLVIPLCSSFWVAAAASSGLGLTSGVVNSARVAKIGALSQESAIPFHLMGMAMCAGNILGPLIISPFLSNTTKLSNASNMSDLVATSIECGGSDSRIAYAYLIIASTGTLLVIVLAVLRYCLRKSPKQDSNKKNKFSFGKMEIIFVSFQISLIFIGGATNFVYGTLLLLFGTRSSLSISATTMALMTSSFYAVTLLGRVGGVFVSLVVPQLCLVTSCLVGVLAGSVFLVCTAEMSSEFLWVGSLFLGLCYAPLFSALLVWFVENVTVNDTLYAIFIFFDLAGTSLIALTIGQLMSHFEPQMLHYSIATIALIQILLFLCLFFLGKWLRKQNKKDYTPLDGKKRG